MNIKVKVQKTLLLALALEQPLFVEKIQKKEKLSGNVLPSNIKIMKRGRSLLIDINKIYQNIFHPINSKKAYELFKNIFFKSFSHLYAR